jgi:hypothetical protein
MKATRPHLVASYRVLIIRSPVVLVHNVLAYRASVITTDRRRRVRPVTGISNYIVPSDPANLLLWCRACGISLIARQKP